MPMSQGDVRDLLSAGLVDDPLYAGSGNGVFNTDCDPGDEDRSPVTSLQARIAALETEAAFWRANYENMKRMRDALLSPEDRPAPSPFTNALKHGWAAARYPTERT